MPTYNYECSKCETVFEVYHSMSENPKIKCPECGKVAKRLIGKGSGVIFKGSGFYETDYKKRSGSPTGRSDAKTETKSESKTESKSETKSSDSTPKTDVKSTSSKSAKAAS